MKHFYAFVVFLALGFSAYAQIVEIPDANFKNKLVNTACATLNEDWPNQYVDVDANNDGEIQESEAAAIYRLYLDDSDIASLQGIAAFSNLRLLIANDNQITSIDFSGLPLLTSAQLNQNQISSVSLNPAIIGISLSGNQISDLGFLNGLSALQFLEVSHNLLTEINWPQNSNIAELVCGNNALTTLDVSGSSLVSLDCQANQLTSLTVNAALERLWCQDNLLSALDLSQTTGLIDLHISNNQLTGIQIPPTVRVLWMSGNLYTSVDLNMPVLYGFACTNTQITSLTIPAFEAAAAEPLDIRDNANLQFINMKNLHTDHYNGDMPNPFYYFWIQDNPNLDHICFDQTELDNASFLQTIADMNNPDMTFSSYCDFVPGQTNTILGNVRYDLDGNGCGNSDEIAPGIGIQFGFGNTVLGETYTNGLGNYASYSGLSQTLTPLIENPYYTVSPSSYAATFTGFGNSQTVDFCIAPNGVHPDLAITIIALMPARPGFDASYKIQYENNGTETQSGSISLAFEDDTADFIASDPMTGTQSASALTWNFNDLAPFESREITLTLNINSPLETPAVNIGDVLNFTASIISGDDETPADNTFNYDQTVVGSYDPNDKAVSREVIDIGHLDDYLYYTVRFQNTGTFYAENVVVKDMLSGNLDLTTLQMVSTSHPYRCTLTAGNKLEFFFEGINLPAVGDDEPGSHGYVTFKIKPVSTLPIFSEIDNVADIYFDFNAPITTNGVATTVNALGNEEVGTSAFVLHPNPVGNTLSVQSAATIASVSIYNTLGQLVKAVSGQTTFDVSELARGSYFVQIVSDKGKTNKKLLKI